jgi:hypothetical protein
MGKRISDWWGRIRPAVGTAYERDSGHVEHTHRVVTVHDAVGPGSPTDKVSWGMRCEHHGGSGNTPDKVAAAVSPKRRVNGEGEDWWWLVDVPRRRQGPVAEEGSDEVLELKEEMGGGEGPPDRGERSVRSSSPWRGKMAMAVA